jgi:hypothetical protein
MLTDKATDLGIYYGIVTFYFIFRIEDHHGEGQIFFEIKKRNQKK